MNLSYNSLNMEGPSKVKTVARFCGVLILIGIAYYAGLSTKPVLAAYETKQVSQTCTSYLNLVFTGDLDKAYEQSGQPIKNQQTLEEYKKTLGVLKTDKATLNKTDSAVSTQTRKNGLCALAYDNLPKTADGRTDGRFTMSVIKDGQKWKVASLSVE